MSALVTAGFTTVAFVVFTWLLLRALAAWSVLVMLLRRLEGQDHPALESVLERLAQGAPRENVARSLAQCPHHPVVKTAWWALHHRIDPRTAELAKDELVLNIEEAGFSDLRRRCRATASAGPAWGMFFTVGAIMVTFALMSGQGLTPETLRAVGTALGTTAAGVLVQRISASVVDGKLAAAEEALLARGVRAINRIALTHAVHTVRSTPPAAPAPGLKR